MSNPNDYTVGWVSALDTELTAAKAFLDEMHEKVKVTATGDINSYTLGKIGQHDVVIAVLPDGEYGIASAALVVANMLRSFLNLRFILMVGIGGGAPSPRHDIRLGDVVVSRSLGGTAAVYQYDFGKRIQNQGFQTTGFLNLPPTLLRTAINGLKTKHEILGHEYEKEISKVLKKYPRLRKKYSRPNQLNDKLYRSGVVHPTDDNANCEETCGNDEKHLVFRPERTEDEDNPAVHYGPIASANTLMKDSTIRDRIAAEKGILCFEMEAAGIMNQFPCLVIRGICDYSDSHRNDKWQGYAAMTAAAYAKDLLRRIPRQEVKLERRIIDFYDLTASGMGPLPQPTECHSSSWIDGLSDFFRQDEL
ncbi:nucleoside phosphorylase domain-containing protein [Trichoderma velutinum]